jgi:hypothetical protein
MLRRWGRILAATKTLATIGVFKPTVEPDAMALPRFQGAMASPRSGWSCSLYITPHATLMRFGGAMASSRSEWPCSLYIKTPAATIKVALLNRGR